MGKKYEEVSDSILNGLKKFDGFFSREYYLDFEDRIGKMKENIQESMREGRLLKIGIVGEVKAGKSSFLNALIFDGKDVLPKASTPMTAALTKITYSEKPSATIVFYSEKDWENVIRFSEEYDSEFEKYYNKYVKDYYQKNQTNMGAYIQPLKSKDEMAITFKELTSLKLRSCKELTEMFDKSEEDLASYLGSTIELPIEDIDNGLYDYIGVEGKFTAIVKHVELKMNNEMLREVEIVDTPGLNDPIVSRGETTKRFLRECDVVFLLSGCNQFLTSEDISFMCDTLPNEGIRNIIVVGSKFDAGILDDNKSKSINVARNSTRNICNYQAEESIKRCMGNAYNREALKRINDSLPPSYVSSVLYSCAEKKKAGISYTKQEQHIINQLKMHFKDFEEDEKILMTLSGIQQLKKNKLIPIMNSKKEIIDEKNREILSDNKRYLLKLLEDITIQVVQNKEDVERYDKDQLQAKLEKLQSKLNSMRREIRNIFDNESVEAARCLNDMKVAIAAETKNYIDFDVYSKTRTEHGSYRTGIFGWRVEHYTEEVTTYTAAVSDVISNIRGYVNRCQEYANEEFEKIININNLKNSIKRTAIGAFDLSGRDFNENDILIPIEIVVKKIQIPKIDIDVAEFEKMIVDAFSGAKVDGDDIHKLRLKETEILGIISKRIKTELDHNRAEIENTMTVQATTFVDNIIEQMKSNMELIKNQLDDKEAAVKKYTDLSDALVEYKKMVKEMEM